MGAGDIAHCDSHSYDTDSLIDTIPGTVFAAGDNAYEDGSSTDYANCYDPTWGRERARTYPALGNHDYNLGNANGYWGYFGTTGFGYPGGYYSSDLGSWHIIVLNSVGTPYVSTDPGSAQEQWLKADLAAHPNTCTLAIWHHPLYFSVQTASNDTGATNWVKPFWVDLYNAGADVMVNGHMHQYERFAPQDPNGVTDSQTGIREFIVGTGGGSVVGSSFKLFQRNSEVLNGTTWGVLKFTLHAASYDWKFIPVRGQTFTDSGTASCHGAKPAVSAGADQLVHPGGRLTFNGTFTDADNDGPWTYTIAWGDGSSSTGSIATQDTIRGSHVYPSLGQYAASLAVTDNGGLTGSANAAVTVSNDDVLVGAGDVARCDTQNDDVTASLLDHVGGTVFTVGDNAYPSGAVTDFSNCYTPTWGRHLARTRPTPGDKDYKTSGASGYFAYFGAAAGDPAKGYYSYDLGSWHIIALNSSISTSTGSAQEQWLKADLAATTQQCVLAYFHYPLFASQTGSQVWGTVQPLWVDLYAARADIVLSAHFQFYERFALQTPTGEADPAGGIREFVVGTGGQTWTSFGVPLPTSQVRSTQSWGVLKLTLHATSYDWQFIPIAGQTLTDAGSTACHTKGSVASVAMSLPSATVSVGSTVQVTATPLDANDNPLSDRVVTWTSSAPAVATVSANGLVSGVAAGSATITATSEGKSGTAAITVTSVPVASVVVSPASASMQVGQTVQLTATTLDANGNVLTGRAIAWTTNAAAVATVDATGLVSGVAPGSATITATSEGKSGTAAITVTSVPVASVVVSPASASMQVGQTVQLTATTLDANGNVLTGRAIAWTTNAAAVARVDATGLVSGVAPGSATITATSETKSGTSAITVTSVPVASVVVSPASASLDQGTTLQLTATPLDANGNPFSGRTVTWVSSAPSLAGVSGSGLVVTGIGSGPATITATSDGTSGTSAVTVVVPASPVLLTGAGNIARCDKQSDEATANVLNSIGGAVFTAADNVNASATATDFTNCYGPSWGRLKVRTRPSAGDKEYKTTGAAGYFGYFGLAAGDPASGYYSYDLADWHVVVLNTSIEMNAGSLQEQWLRADLAANPKQCTVAIFHLPRFSSSGTAVRAAVKPLWDALYTYGAELVVNAHAGVYERFAPQTPAGVADPTTGIRQFTVGTGGQALDKFGTPIANSEVRNNTTYGVLQLTLGAGTYAWNFVPAAGGTFTDSGSGSCH